MPETDWHLGIISANWVCHCEPKAVIADMIRNPWCVWHCRKAWIPDQVRDDSRVLVVLRTPVRPSCGLFLDDAEEFVHAHRHCAHHQQSRKGQAHLHGGTG